MKKKLMQQEEMKQVKQDICSRKFCQQFIQYRNNSTGLTWNVKNRNGIDEVATDEAATYKAGTDAAGTDEI